MLVKVLFNIFLNLALIILAMMFYWTVARGYYPFAAFIVVIFGMFVYFKVLLAKAVKEHIKTKEAQPVIPHKAKKRTSNK